MSSHYLKNLNILHKKYPHIAKKLENLNENLKTKIIYEKNGEANLSFIDTSEKEEKLYLSSEPKSHSAKIMQALKLQYQNPKILVFNGVGLGYHILSYAQNPNPDTLFILIFEASLEVFKQAITLSDFSGIFLHERVILFVGEEEEETKRRLYQLFNNPILLRYSNAIEYIDLKENIKPWENFYNEVKEWVSESIKINFSNYTPSFFQQFQKYENIFKNYSRSLKLPNIYNLKNAFLGKAGMIVSAGPPLKNSISIIEKIQNQIILIASPKSLPLLSERNIKVDFCLDISSNDENRALLEEYSKKLDYFFVAPPWVDPHCYDFHKDRFFSLYPQNTEFSFFPFPKPAIRSCDYFIESACDLLNHLGCTSIVLAGESFIHLQCTQDLTQTYHPNSNQNSNPEQEDFSSRVKAFETASTKNINNFFSQDETGFVFSYSGNKVKADYIVINEIKNIEKNCIPSHQGSFYHLLPEEQESVKIDGAIKICPETLSKINFLVNIEMDKRNIIQKLKKTQPLEIELSEKQILSKASEYLSVLKESIQDFENYGLEIKRHIFLGWSHIEDERTITEYNHFKNYFVSFMERYRLNPQKVPSAKIYFSFIRPLLAGNELIVLSEFFNQHENENKNITAMYIKMGYVYSHCQTASFWLRHLQKCLEYFLNTHQLSTQTTQLQ